MTHKYWKSRKNIARRSLPAEWLAPQTTTRYKPKSQYPLRTKRYSPLLWYVPAKYFFAQNNICGWNYLSLLKHPTDDNTVMVLAYDRAIYLQSLCPVNRGEVFSMPLNWKSFCLTLVIRQEMNHDLPYLRVGAKQKLWGPLLYDRSAFGLLLQFLISKKIN